MKKYLALALLTSVLFLDNAVGQVIEVPVGVQNELAKASKIRADYDVILKRSKARLQAIQDGQKILPLIEELQYAPTKQIPAERDAAKSKLLSSVQNDTGHPFLVSQTNRKSLLRSHGIDADNVNADVDLRLLRVGLQAVVRAIESELGGSSDDQSHLCEGILRELERVKTEESATRELVIRKTENQESNYRKHVSLREKYVEYLQFTADVGSLDQPEMSPKYNELGRRLLHLKIMRAEDYCSTPTENKAFHEQLAETLCDEIRNVSKRRPTNATEFSELAIRKKEYLAMLSFISAKRVDAKYSQGTNAETFLDPGKLLDSIKSGPDAVRVREWLIQQTKEWQGFYDKNRNGGTTAQKWKNDVRIDAISLWYTALTNSQKSLNGKVIRCETISQKQLIEELKKTAPDSRRVSGRRGGRSPRPGFAPEALSTTLSSTFPSHNSPAWRVTCGDAEFFLTPAIPAYLNVRNKSEKLDSRILEYLDASGRVQRVDSRIATTVDEAKSFRVFVGADYRPKQFKSEDFIPAFATIGCGQDAVGFVIAYVSPGSGDVELRKLFETLLAK